MAKVTVKINLNNVNKQIKRAVQEAIQDCADDLIRTSSETAPHDKGILEQSYGKSVYWNGNKYIAMVDYFVREENSQGDFNYAYWIHENEDYKLGPNSEKKAEGGGGVGMSGTAYPVGNHFLTRPLYGEQEAYKQHIQNVIDEAMK
jgi:hypothetical protein